MATSILRSFTFRAENANPALFRALGETTDASKSGRILRFFRRSSGCENGSCGRKSSRSFQHEEHLHGIGLFSLRYFVIKTYTMTHNANIFSSRLNVLTRADTAARPDPTHLHSFHARATADKSFTSVELRVRTDTKSLTSIWSTTNRCCVGPGPKKSVRNT